MILANKEKQQQQIIHLSEQRILKGKKDYDKKKK